MFNALDRTGKGFLTAADMRPFAEQTGFTGTDREWQLEFEALCHESRSSQGLGLDAFAKLVNDDSEDGCYCTDSELQALLQGLHQGSVENNTSVPNSTPSRTIGQPLQATEARTTHHTIERTYTCGSLGREEGRDGGRGKEGGRGDRERERLKPFWLKPRVLKTVLPPLCPRALCSFLSLSLLQGAAGLNRGLVLSCCGLPRHPRGRLDGQLCVLLRRRGPGPRHSRDCSRR